MIDETFSFDRPRYFYLAPLMRRLFLIFIAGLIGVPLVFLAARRLLLGQAVQFQLGWAVAITAGSLFVASSLRARIRVDGEGIARRTLFGWRSTPWEEITGRPAATLCVGEGPATHAPQPIYKLYIKLDGMEEPDAVLLYRLLTPTSTATHLPKAPEKFRAQVFGHKWIEIDGQGLRLEENGELQSWFWTDVEQIKAGKERSSDPGFKSLRFHFRDGTELPLVDGTVECEPECRGRRDFLLLQFLRQVVPADKLLVYALHGPPMSVADAEHRHSVTQSNLCTGRSLTLVFGVALIALLCWGVLGANEVAKHLAIVLIAHGIVCGPIACKLVSDERAKRQMLEAYLRTRGRPVV